MLKKPKYCPEKWEDMGPVEGGRTCYKCEKFIKDFTKNSWDEIEDIQSSSAGPFCGVYTPKQIRNWKKPIESKISQFKSKVLPLALMSSFLLPLSEVKGANKNLAESVTTSPIDLKRTPEFDKKPKKSNSDQVLNISGTVIDSNTKEPIKGVTVALFKDQVFVGGVFTNEFGKFSIEISDRKNISFPVNLTIKYMSYFDKTIELKNAEELLVEMNYRELNLEVFYIYKASRRKTILRKFKSLFRRKK